VDGTQARDASAQTRQIVDRELGFPARLSSAHDVGRELEHKGAVPSLRELLNQTEHWLAGKQVRTDDGKLAAAQAAVKGFFPAQSAQDQQEVRNARGREDRLLSEDPDSMLSADPVSYQKPRRASEGQLSGVNSRSASPDEDARPASSSGHNTSGRAGSSVR
jgi:hypothetical protein